MGYMTFVDWKICSKPRYLHDPGVDSFGVSLASFPHVHGAPFPQFDDGE